MKAARVGAFGQAANAGRFDVIAQLAQELEARRLETSYAFRTEARRNATQTNLTYHQATPAETEIYSWRMGAGAAYARTRLLRLDATLRTSLASIAVNHARHHLRSAMRRRAAHTREIHRV